MATHGDFFAWLIEYAGAKPVPVYVPEQHGGFYTCNPWCAKRFESREEAEAYMSAKNYSEPWKVIEHGFIESR